jgi:hypothetical protein
MSTFLVHPIHIAAVVGSQGRYGPADGDVSELSAMAERLALENVASVAYSQKQPASTLPPPLPSQAQLEAFFLQPLTPVALLKAIQCLQEQCGAHPAWLVSTAARSLELAQYRAIAALPGYAQLPWELTPQNAESGRAPLREVLLSLAPSESAPTPRAQVALDSLQQLGGGGRAGAAEVLFELLSLDATLVEQTARRR